MLSNSLLTFPNLAFFFGESGSDAVGPFEVMHSFVLDGLAKIYITRVGAFGFVFDEVGAFGSANTPDKKAGSQKNAITLQERRIALANFVAAGIFGRHAGRTSRPLVGAHYAGLDAAFSFRLSGLMRPGRVYDDGLSISDFGDDLYITLRAGDNIERIAGSKITRYFRRDKQELYIASDSPQDCTTYVANLISRSKLFHYADLQSLMRMNYQALVLHDQQHPEASLALNAVVSETLVSEIFFAYGLVGTRPPQVFATRSHHATPVSNSAFHDMRLADRLKHLTSGGLLEPTLFERIDAVRLARNALMHKGEALGSRRSLEGQTTVRDLWALLIDAPFALTARPGHRA